MPDINAAEVTDRAISWLKTNGHERFFLWIHYFEPHAPYRPPGDVELPPPSGRKPLLPIAACPRIRDLPKDIEYKGYMAHGRRDIDFFIDLYDRLIRYADREFGRLLDFISSRSWSPSCTVLVSSDHGEAFGQHNGIMEHGAIVYEEQIRVPLIVHTGQDFQRRNIIREPVSMIDLMPTVCEIMTGRIPENLEGRSLVPLLKGGRPRHRPLISEIVEPWHKDGVSWSAVMAGRHKILYGTFQNPEFLYYDLSEDPCELNPKEITPWVEITSPTLFHLKRLLVRYMKRPYPPGTEPLSPEVEEMLRAMGYLQ